MQQNFNVRDILSKMSKDNSEIVYKVIYLDSKLYTCDKDKNPVNLFGFYDRSDIVEATYLMKYLPGKYPYIIEEDLGGDKYNQIYNFFLEDLIMKLVGIIWNNTDDTEEFEMNDIIADKIIKYFNDIPDFKNHVHKGTQKGIYFNTNNPIISYMIQQASIRARMPRN